MCGIVGYWSLDSAITPDTQARKMADAMHHRGPDAFNAWHDTPASPVLAHRRLSILDLSENGLQPMASHNDRYVIIYNGEIYNHPALRQQLDATTNINWRGTSDTETLLACITHWGLAATLDAMNGMFAFALWDKAERTLTLARDRAGEKPLYYGFQGKSFLFGSTLAPLKQHPDWQGQIDRAALTGLVRHNYVPAPLSIFKGIHKLLPGHTLTLSTDQMTTRDLPSPKPYWQISDFANTPRNTPDDIDGWLDEFETLLRDAVKSRMLSDVPLGAFLSGGIDSSTIVALMQAQSTTPIKTFSIGFDDPAFNEAEHAKAIAAHLGTDHEELYVTAQDSLDVIPHLPKFWDEPFADSSQIPTYLVSKLARTKVTVSLSGDGGDELFCGYERYRSGAKHWQRLSKTPLFMRGIAARAAQAIPAPVWNRILSALLKDQKTKTPAAPLLKMASLATNKDFASFYRDFVSISPRPDQLVNQGQDYPNMFTDEDWPALLPTLEDQMMMMDVCTYLPDDILTKVDRASMAVSLEARVPLLDHRVIEHAQTITTAFKQRNGQSKWPLRQILYRHVPADLIERPKKGFSVPLNDWLRGPLRDWGQALIDDATADSDGFFNQKQVQKLWDDHQAGRMDQQSQLWPVLMFQQWHSANTN